MTKDAEKMLFCLYGIFKEKNKTESRTEAKETTIDEIVDKCNSIFHSDDVYELILELKENGYIEKDVIDNVTIQNSLIETIENQPKETFAKIIDFISKLK